jgi:DNA-binding CsgD family transcriptional regulator
LIVQDSIFRSPSWTQLLNEAVNDFVLVRFPDRLEELVHCASHFPLSIAIAECSLLDVSEPPPGELARLTGALRWIARVNGAESPDSLERLLLLGCYGFVQDGISPASLQRVLRGVAVGEMAVGRKLLSRAFQRLLAGRSAPKLSRREQEILALLGQRLSNRVIAGKLFISEETLRWHLRNLYSKTELQKRTDLVEFACSRAGTADSVESKSQSATHDGL